MSPRTTLFRALAGIVISSAIAAVGFQRGALTGSGATGAVLTGTATTIRGGWGRAALLVGFFVTSSGLPRLLGSKTDPLHGVLEKSGRRDIWQVTANGGVSTAITFLSGSGEPHRLAYLGSLAAVAGDTWATEVGMRSSEAPRHILRGGTLSPGQSGGVTAAGTTASFAGGAVIGAIAALSGLIDPAYRSRQTSMILTGAIIGGVGSLIDSLIGATIQERRWCPLCDMPTERRTHTCGQPTRHAGGLPGLTNDGVNFLCSAFGALVGAIAEQMLERDRD